MAQRQDQAEPDPKAEFDARIDRLEKELGDRLDDQAANDPLLTSPPKAMPIPEVLRERPRTGEGHRQVSIQSQSSLARLYAVGMTFGVTVLVGIGVGWAIDYFAKSTPWGLLGGLAVGFLVGIVRLFKDGMAANREALADLKNRRR